MRHMYSARKYNNILIYYLYFEERNEIFSLSLQQHRVNKYLLKEWRKKEKNNFGKSKKKIKPIETPVQNGILIYTRSDLSLMCKYIHINLFLM